MRSRSHCISLISQRVSHVTCRGGPEDLPSGMVCAEDPVAEMMKMAKRMLSSDEVTILLRQWVVVVLSPIMVDNDITF